MVTAGVSIARGHHSYDHRMVDEWTVLPGDEALRRAGANAAVVEAGPVTYARGDAAFVLIVDAGDRPGGSMVDSRTGIELSGPFPGPVPDWLHRFDLPWLGFARLPEGCVPLGEVHSRGGIRYDLVLEQPLSFAVLDRIRPAAVQPVPDVDWLTDLPRDRTAALRRFLTGWYADVPEQEAEPVRSAVPLPEPLLAFYELAARRPVIYGTHNRVDPPGALYYDDWGRVPFAAENQSVWGRSFDPGEDDPRVWGDGLPDRERLSGFLLQFALTEAVFEAPYAGHAELSEEQRDRFVRKLTPVPLAPAPIPEEPTRIFVAPGLVAITFPFEGTQLSIASRQRAALREFRDPGFTWDAFNG